jgi:NADPH2:quinone reductase
MPHIAQRERLDAMAAELFQMVLSGKVRIKIDQRYPLAEVARVHRELEGRQTTGSTVMLP